MRVKPSLGFIKLPAARREEPVAHQAAGRMGESSCLGKGGWGGACMLGNIL